MHSCQNNPEKSYTEKKTKHTPSGYSLFTNCSFDAAKNKLDCYRGKDCLEKFCKELSMRIVNYEKKEIILVTDEENKSCEKQKVCCICKKNLMLLLLLMMMITKSIIKSEIIVITLENLEEPPIIFVI